MTSRQLRTENRELRRLLHQLLKKIIAHGNPIDLSEFASRESAYKMLDPEQQTRIDAQVEYVNKYCSGRPSNVENT